MKTLIICLILSFANPAYSESVSKEKAVKTQTPSEAATKPEIKVEENSGAKKPDSTSKISSTKIKGTIVKSRVEKGVNASEVLVMVATKNGNETVHLGPEWYIKNHSLTLQEGQTLEAHGWQSDMKGQRLFMAMDVEVGTWRMTLRDAYGRPMWRGGPKK
ncbi:MAG: hypothetical protein KBD78_00545 [Oligoflexales bacterium]|nr:hypothetical protein [Oligoflexales bacterium]